MPSRPPRVDDKFNQEDLRSFLFAPDGEAVAFLRWRPVSSQVMNALHVREIRSDVWVQERPDLPARNLTNGVTDASGWWMPEWSPDGKRLACLSSRGGNVTLWVWDRGTTTLRQVSTDGVAFHRRGSLFDRHESFRWVDDHRIVAMVVPEGERAAPIGMGGYEVGLGVELATSAWAKAARGESTARAIHSLKTSFPRYRLVLIDIAAKSSRTLVRTNVDWARSWWLSPAGQAIVVLRAGPSSFTFAPRYAMGFPVSIDLIGLDGRELDLNRPLPSNVVTSTIAWSPDGQELAFFALEDRLVHPELIFGEGARDVVYPPVTSKEYPGRLWRVNVARGVVEQIGTGDVDLGQQALPPAFEWTAAGDLLFRAPRLTNGARPVRPLRSEWLRLGRDGQTRPLVSESTAPAELQSIRGGTAFMGLSDGDLWVIDPAQGIRKNLTASLAPNVLAFRSQEDSRGTVLVLMTAADEPTNDAERVNASYWRLGFRIALGSDYLLDVKTGVSTRLARPTPEARAVEFSAATRSVVFSTSNRNGDFAWRTVGAAAPEPLAVANTLMRRIVEFDARIIEYSSLNGQKFKARITLPLGYQPGRRYPLVVDSDTSSTPASVPFEFEQHAIQTPLLADGDLFAAAGYMYMWASMPIDGMDKIGRANLLSFTDGILPAVDKAIDLGLADPDRLFLYGTSSMAHGVMGLVTQTSRFRAAVAAYGWADQIIHGLDLNAVQRYREIAFDQVPIGVMYSNSRLPFWREGDQRRRNSPLSYVDRVQTPIMIVNSEFDSIAPTSAEMFFAALSQQRKPAQFVHYWGEGHFVTTPANIRDYWRRVFAWFDEYGDVNRDATGTMIFDADRVRSRKGAAPLAPEDFSSFDFFQPSDAPARTTIIQKR